MSYGVSTAAAAILSQRKGAGDQEGIQRAAWQSMIIIAGLSLVLGLVGGLGAGFIVRDLIGAKGDVATVATSLPAHHDGRQLLDLLPAPAHERAARARLLEDARGAARRRQRLQRLPRGAAHLRARARAELPRRGRPTIARVLHIPRMGMVGAAWASIIARVPRARAERVSSSRVASTCFRRRESARRIWRDQAHRVDRVAVERAVLPAHLGDALHQLARRALLHDAGGPDGHDGDGARLPPRHDGALRRDGLGHRRADLRRAEPRREARTSARSRAAGSRWATTS